MSLTAAITEPGVYPGIPDAEYHADPIPEGSISTSGAKDILKAPALYQWRLTHRVEKRAYDVGHAVHARVLGVGMKVQVLDFDSWRTKAAREAQAEAYAAGEVPILAADYQPIRAMTEAVLTHPIARRVFEREGFAEASAFAIDPETGRWMRARPDHLPAPSKGRTIIGDLKTAVSADPDDFRKDAARYGYDIQSEWYQAVIRAARGDEDTAFVFVIVEKSEPYLVSVVELDEEYADIGRSRMRRALDTYHRCRTENHWPGYPPIVHTAAPPVWHAIAEQDASA